MALLRHAYVQKRKHWFAPAQLLYSGGNTTVQCRSCATLAAIQPALARHRCADWQVSDIELLPLSKITFSTF